MFCPNCGTENAEGTKFCASCGTGLEAAPATPAENAEPANATSGESKKLNIRGLWASLMLKAKPVLNKISPFVQQNKLLVTGVAGGVALVLCIVIIIAMLTAGNGFTAYEHAIYAYTNDGKVLVRYDANKIIETEIEAERIDGRQSSMDGSVYVFLTSEGELAVVKSKKVTMVAEDVTSFVLSASGTHIGYIAGDEDDSELFLYTIKNKKNVTITDETVTSYDLSPDGKSVAYLQQSEDDEKATLMYFNGSKSEKVTSGEMTLLGLSNKGKYIYIASEKDDEEVLYSYNTKGDREKLGNIAVPYVMFNEDHTQILFYNGKSQNDLKTYLSTKGKEGVKISSSRAMVLRPEGSSLFVSGNNATVPTDDLYNKVYICVSDNQRNAWYIRKNTDKSTKLANDIGDCTLDESGKYLYYTDDGDLKVLKVSDGDSASDKAKLLATDVDNYVVTSNRSQVYYVSDNALYSCNGKKGGSKKTIASDDVETYSLAINRKDVVYYIMDDDAYACSNGSKGTKVASDVEDINGTTCGIVYVETEDTLYATSGAKKLTKIYEEG